MNILSQVLGLKDDENEEIGEPGSESNPIVSRSGSERRRAHRRIRRIRNKFARHSQRDYIREIAARGGYPAGVSFPIGTPDTISLGRREPKGVSKYGVRRDVKEAQRASATGASLVAGFLDQVDATPMQRELVHDMLTGPS